MNLRKIRTFYWTFFNSIILHFLYLIFFIFGLVFCCLLGSVSWGGLTSFSVVRLLGRMKSRYCDCKNTEVMARECEFEGRPHKTVGCDQCRILLCCTVLLQLCYTGQSFACNIRNGGKDSGRNVVWYSRIRNIFMSVMHCVGLCILYYSFRAMPCP